MVGGWGLVVGGWGLVVGGWWLAKSKALCKNNLNIYQVVVRTRCLHARDAHTTHFYKIPNNQQPTTNNSQFTINS
ncbi:MAG: hypothetical protein ACHBN1_14750 [Heteroscytonema crispum UTEX LB 1556]